MGGWGGLSKYYKNDSWSNTLTHLCKMYTSKPFLYMGRVKCKKKAFKLAHNVRIHIILRMQSIVSNELGSGQRKS